MARVLCPECGTRAAGADAFWGHEKPYCSLCGWNIPAAIDSQRALLRQFQIALYLVGAFFALLAIFARDRSTLIAFLFLSAVLLVACLLTRKKLQTLTRRQTATASSPASVVAAKEKTLRERTAALERVRSMPRPRRVRLKIVPRIISVLFPLSWVFILFFGFQFFGSNGQNTGAFPDNGLLLFAVLVPAAWTALCVWILGRARRDRRLLTDGEVSRATISSQWMAGSRHPVSKIAYSFHDAAGRPVQSEVTDTSRSLYEQMEVWAFYDPLNSARHVLAPCAYCELQDA